MVALAAVPAAASAAVDLDGSFSRAVHKRDYFDGSTCPPNVDGNECGVIQLVGLGPADFVYLYGPTFEPNGRRGCFDLDGTFTISLQSDGSTISGPLTGVLCRARQLRVGAGRDALLRQPVLAGRQHRVRRWDRPVRGAARHSDLPPVVRWGPQPRNADRHAQRLSSPPCGRHPAITPPGAGGICSALPLGPPSAGTCRADAIGCSRVGA